ncbi:hypothetical protein C8R46DRAFT_1114465 [Mycena filopes]|nr:hypothetical protein C8R46DRAFT_1114465 [Mycena filopes]
MTPRSEETSGIKRRLQGSCDLCKKKKVRCDSAEMPGKWCTNCITLKVECTHGGSKASGSTHRLSPLAPSTETPQEYIAAILSTTVVYIPPNDPTISHQLLVKISRYARELEETVASLREALDTRAPTAAGASKPPPQDHAQDLHGGKSIGRQFLKTTLAHMHGNISNVLSIQHRESSALQPVLIQSPHQNFPEDELLKSLVDLYFREINPVLGFLHGPSFIQSVSDGLHHRDPYFGAVLLVVCSLGSRYSDDSRVFIKGASEYSCGWKWFRQVLPISSQFSPEHSLHQLQLICLSIQYVVATGISSPSDPAAALSALGLRFAQAAGVTRRSGYTFTSPLTSELYKRVAWILRVSDTIMNFLQGRSTAVESAGFDLDLPVDNGEWGLQESTETPSSDAFVPVYIQLITIFGRIQSAVYPVDGQVCSEDVVVELDSALNEWLDLVPQHLKWDPHQENQVFLAQSAALYSTYYHAQILIHRPFIPPPGRDTVLPEKFPSLAICANAARLCAHVLDVQTRRARPLHNAHIINSLFDSAVVLLVNVWAVVRGRKARGREDLHRATADVENCLRILRLYERRWRLAGRDCEIVSAMLKTGNHEYPSSNITPDFQGQPSADASPFSSQQLHDPDNLFSLPLSTDELGRLPIYDSFDPHFYYTAAPNDFQLIDAPVSNAAAQIELFPDADMTIGSMLPMQHDGNEMQPLPNSFNMASGYRWQEWSTYLASLDGLNQGP